MACNQQEIRNVKSFDICIAPKSGKVSFGSRTSGGDSMSSFLSAGHATIWTVEGVAFDDFIMVQSPCSYADNPEQRGVWNSVKVLAITHCISANLHSRSSRIVIESAEHHHEKSQQE